MTETEEDAIVSALAWFGEPAEKLDQVDICDDGSVFLGLTLICERGTIAIAVDR
jgi:hypothetical protein